MSTLADLLIEIGIDPKGVDKGGKEVEGKLSKTWKGMGAAAAIGGAAVGAALMTGMQSIIESSKPIALLQAQLGATGEFAGDIGKVAGDLYSRGVVESMEDATAAIKAVWQNKLIDEDATDAQIEAVGAKLSNLAMIAEDETGNVANAVKQMMRNGLIKNVEEGFDLLTRGVQEGVNKSGDLFDTFNEYGTQFRQLGLDGATSMGLMNQAIKAGARDADTAADALKEFAIRAIDGSKTSAAGFQALGLNAEQMTAQIAKGGESASDGLGLVLEKLKGIDDPVKRNAAAVALFGTKAEDLGQALFAMDPKTAVKGLGDVAGAADKAGDTLENSAGAKLESFKRKALAGLTTELAKMLPAIEATFGFIQKNSSWIEPLAIGIGILATAIGIITAVQWAWNIAMTANPIGLIIAGIALLIAGIVLIATKTRFFQTIWEAVWGFMKGVGAWFAGPFAGFFVTLWNKLKAAFTAGKNFVVNVIKGIIAYYRWWWNTGKSIIAGVISTFGKVVSFVRGLPGKVRGALANMFSPLWQGFKSAINRIIAGWNNLSFGIPGFNVGPVSFPGVSVGTPNIPMLAKGGIATGPTMAMIGEGGEDEAVIPLSKLPELAGRDDRPIVLEIVGAETEFRRWLKKSIRVKGSIAGTATA